MAPRGPVWGLGCVLALAALLSAVPGPSQAAEMTAAARIERLKALLLHGHTHGYTTNARQPSAVADSRGPRILLELSSSHSHAHPHTHRALPHSHGDEEEDHVSSHTHRTDAIDAHEFQQDVDAALDDPEEGTSLLELASQIKARQQAHQRSTASASASAHMQSYLSTASAAAKGPATKAPGKHAPGGMAKGPAGLTNDCKIDYVEVKVHEEKEIDPASKYKTAQDVVKHLLFYAGSITDHSGKPTKSGVHAGRMAHPKKVPWVDTRKYHFECYDGRGDHAMLGAPGGDLAEFALALNAFEHTKGLSDAMDQKRVDVYFRDFLGEIDGQFYGHTDAIGWFQWSAELKKRVGKSNPLKLDTPDKKEVALSLAAQFYGCTHIQMMIGKEDAYRVRADLVRQVVRAFFTVLMDEGNILRSKLEFSILTGYPNREQGIVNIMSPGPNASAAGGKPQGAEGKEGAKGKEKKEDPRLKGCFYRAPLMVPRLNLSPEQSLGIIHPRAMYEKRAVYTEYLTRQEKKDEAWKWKLFALMNDIGKAQLEETKKTLWGDKTKYVAEFKFE